MNKLLSLSAKIFPPVLLLVFSLAGPTRAGGSSTDLGARFQASVTTMVESVRATQDPAVKRGIIGEFLNRVDLGMGRARYALPAKDIPQLDLMRAKVERQYAELNGLNGCPKVADADLNPFSRYIQQDMEQAGIYFRGRERGGFFFYGGCTFLLLLLILLLLVERPYR